MRCYLHNFLTGFLMLVSTVADRSLFQEQECQEREHESLNACDKQFEGQEDDVRVRTRRDARRRPGPS